MLPGVQSSDDLLSHAHWSLGLHGLLSLGHYKPFSKKEHIAQQTSLTSLTNTGSPSGYLQTNGKF